MGLKLNVYCDGPTCALVESYPDQRRILPPNAPKDWLVIKIETWRQVHKSAVTSLCAPIDSTRYFCSSRCLTLFSLVWWLGIEYVARDQILIDIRRLDTDEPLPLLGELPPNTPIHRT
jgi:hypothetical protein